MYHDIKYTKSLQTLLVWFDKHCPNTVLCSLALKENKQFP